MTNIKRLLTAKKLNHVPEIFNSFLYFALIPRVQQHSLWFLVTCILTIELWTLIY